jgi:hypothetical protein
MGLFKSLRQIEKQAKELGRGHDPVAQMRGGLASMQAATSMLAQQNATAHLAHTGLTGSAMITALRDTGTRLNEMPMVELGLLVTVEGRPPYPVSLQCVVPLVGMSKLGHGQQVAVRVDPVRPQSVAVMWGELS